MLRAAFTSALHRPALQASHSKTAWLLRFSGATCPQSEHRCDVYAAGTCSTRPRALCSNRATSSPQPLAADLAVEAAFLHDVAARALNSAARRAGHRAHLKSSTQIVSKPRATSVVVFSTQSGGDLLRGRSTSRWPVWFVRAGEIRVAPGQTPLQPAQPLGSPAVSQVHAAARRSTGQPRPQRRGQYRPRCRHRVAGSGRGSRKRDVPTARAIRVTR